ncbi:MAG: hypothetical protein JRJ60_07040 [Deltaproteobacteria bacterium]|nr:hypothetical protein [Deltaproteobacteria bacterium]
MKQNEKDLTAFCGLYCGDCIRYQCRASDLSNEECGKLDFLKPFHGDASIKNLRKIAELGLVNWAKNRDKCYPWL